MAAPKHTDRAALERRWRERGFSCELWTDPPGQVWTDFVHQVDELLMVVEGELEIQIAGKRMRPASGEEILIPAGALHTVRNVGGATALWLYGYRSRT
ncbi:MAG: cupin domain-containing protein [Candidatus Binataceae bacterium]